MIRPHVVLASCLIGLLPSAAAVAQTRPASAPASMPASRPSTGPATQSTTFDHTVTVSPAAPPTPALRYQFRFDRSEQVPGNGAVGYLQALLQLPDQKLLDDLNDANFDTDDDAAFVRLMKDKFAWCGTPVLVDSAIRRETCVWDFPVHHDGIGTLLPYLNHMRELANFLSPKARLATATGDWKQALNLARATFLLADAVDRSDPDTFLVTELVALGIQDIALDQVERLVQRPDAPNLYWALRQLPVPFGNVRAAVLNEHTAWGLSFPPLEKAWRGETLSADEWRQVVYGLHQQITGFQFMDPKPPTDAEFEAGLVRDGPAGRADYARRHGMTADAVAALDPVFVVGAFYFDGYRDAQDDITKWAVLPYPESLAPVAAATRRIDALRHRQPNNPFLAVRASESRCLTGSARLDRRAAALAAVEALRAYAAAHDGRLPAALADVTETPPPPNPATGKSFDYTVTGDTAVVSDNDAATGKPLRYTVRVRR